MNALGGKPNLIPGIEPQARHGDTWPNPGFRGNLSSGNCMVFGGKQRERELDSSQTCYPCSVLQPAVSLLGVFSSRIATERTPSNQGEIFNLSYFPYLNNNITFPCFSSPLTSNTWKVYLLQLGCIHIHAIKLILFTAP